MIILKKINIVLDLLYCRYKLWANNHSWTVAARKRRKIKAISQPPTLLKSSL